MNHSVNVAEVPITLENALYSCENKVYKFPLGKVPIAIFPKKIVEKVNTYGLEILECGPNYYVCCDYDLKENFQRLICIQSNVQKTDVFGCIVS